MSGAPLPREFAHFGRSVERSLLQLAVDSAFDVILIMDARSLDECGMPRIVFASAAVESQTGYAPDELIGKSTAIFFGPRTNPEAVATLVRVTQTLEPASVEMVNYRKDGSEFWTEVNTRPVLDEGQTITHWITVRRDVTRRKTVEDALRSSEERYRLLFDSNPNPMWVYDRKTLRFLAINDAAIRAYGYSRQEFLSMAVTDIRTPEDAERFAAEAKRFQAETYRESWRHRRRDGSMIDVEISGKNVVWLGRPARLVLATDVTDRRRAEEALRDAAGQLELLVMQMPALLYTADKELRITSHQGAAEATLGVGRNQMIGKPLAEVMGSLDPNQRSVPRELERAVNGQASTFERKFAGRTYQNHVEPLRDNSGAIIGIIGIALDVTEQKDAEHRLARMANYDADTDLPNRRLLEDRLDQACAHARRARRFSGVLSVDINRFKRFNETFGHAAADELLVKVARRLSECLRTADTLARVGADEFVVALADMARAEDAASAAQKYLDALAAPFQLKGQEVYVSAAIGISLFPLDGETPQELVQKAESAMVEAKKRGDNTFQLFTQSMQDTAVERLALESALRRAIERNEFVVHYQPIVNLKTGTIAALEALVRWQHPSKGLVAPLDFIPLAEETGLIGLLGERVLREACRQFKLWEATQPGGMRLAVNISARQFAQEGFAKSVERALTGSQLAPERLELEITESAVVNDVDEAQKVFENLKSLGVRLSLDDFGTGYSALGYLKRFPFDTIKIDRAFVRGIDEDPFDEAIAASIVALGRSLDLNVTAEGVETSSQLGVVKGLRCDEAQGYLFSRPLEAAELERLLQDRGAFGGSAQKSKLPNGCADTANRHSKGRAQSL